MKNRKRSRNRWLRIVCLVVIAVCVILIVRVQIQSVKHETQQSALKELVETQPELFSNVESPMEEVSASQSTETDETQPETQSEMLSQYEALYEENRDLVGWLSIKDMKIDYPVMQCADDEYYLHHDFYGADSKYGCLYIRNQADLDTGTNFIIYGHNMKDGSMFGDLDLYLQESFYSEHPVISFDTLYEKRTYEIIAVFRSQVYDSDDDVFKYYQFYEAKNEEEFNDFYRNVKKLSIYDTHVEAAFGDTFLTLSTCAYHVTDGRLVVVAKRVN